MECGRKRDLTADRSLKARSGTRRESVQMVGVAEERGLAVRPTAGRAWFGARTLPPPSFGGLATLPRS